MTELKRADVLAIAERLKASSEKASAGLRYQVLWERVVGHARNEALIRQIQATNPRRNRHERRLWAKLVLQAMRLGILVPADADSLPTGEPVG